MTSRGTEQSLPDRQAMQMFLKDVGWKRAEEATDQAQDLIYDAWEAKTKPACIKLARKALTISPLCADAFVLLASKAATSLEQAQDYYQRGVEAGELALGEHAEEYRGHYWGMIETRPYMRARQGLAGTLWDLGNRTEAITHYQAMLELNPNDNQGVRGVLASNLLTIKDFTAVKELLQKYEDDYSATLVYTKALMAFREATKIAREAFARNKYVPGVLAGVRPGVAPEDAYLTVGGEDEATSYVDHNLAAWKDMPGAIEWLNLVTAERTR